MTTPLMDNTVLIATGTAHAPTPGKKDGWSPHPAATKPAYDHVMQYAWVAMAQPGDLYQRGGA